MHIKGTAVKTIKDFVEKQYPNGYKNWIQEMPAESKNIFLSIIDVSQWYSVQYGAIEPTKAIGKLFFEGDVIKAAYESGRFGAQVALTGIYKVFVMIATPAFIIERASRMMASYYKSAIIEVKEKKDKYCIVHLQKLPDKSPLIEMRIAGWISKAFEITGCKEVKVEIPKSLSKNDPLTELKITWQ
jgi:hypothetical protein